MSKKKKKMSRHKKMQLGFVIIIILVLLFSVLGVAVLYLGSGTQGITQSAPSYTIEGADTTVTVQGEDSSEVVIPAIQDAFNEVVGDQQDTVANPIEIEAVADTVDTTGNEPVPSDLPAGEDADAQGNQGEIDA